MQPWPAPPWMSSSALIADAIAPFNGSPQVIAMREIAIDGACGPWSTAATSVASKQPRLFRRRPVAADHQPDHLGKRQCADQLLDRIAAHRDPARLDVDDRGRPPAAGLVEALLGALGAPACDSLIRPGSDAARRSSDFAVAGRGEHLVGVLAEARRRRVDVGVAARHLEAGPRHRQRPSMPDTCSNVFSSRRCWICGKASACGTLSTAPAGTPIRFSSVSQSAQLRVPSVASSSTFSASRWRLRLSRFSKRGSVTRSSRPRTRASASNCSCLLAAMLMRPSFALKAPDGAAVKLSLPWAFGSTPAIRKFETDPAHRGERRVEHRHVDEGALARRVAPHQRAADRERSGHAGERVGDRIADPQRRALARAGDAHHPGQALDDLVVGRGGIHRAFLTEPRDRAIDETRVDDRQLVRTRGRGGASRRAGSSRPARRRLPTRRRRTSLPSAIFRLRVTDLLPAFCARNDAPM